MEPATAAATAPTMQPATPATSSIPPASTPAWADATAGQPISGPPGAYTAPAWASTAPAAGGTPAPQRSSRLKLGIVAAVSAVIVIGGGVAVAQAASDSNNTQNGPAAGRAPGGGQGFPGGQGNQGRGNQGQGQGFPNNQGQNGGGGAQGFPGGGFGRGGISALGGALHGDFVVKDGNGQYVTQRLQTGAVTAVSATSITAKSEDGHATTYVVGDGTKVDNGAAKIADVKSGDTVTVIGTVSGDTATASEITDTALMRQGNGGNGQRPANPRPTKTT
ncbi:hypothetical protein ACPPVO_28730 [Dactylosporangium sp. McL0621]|uniref:hypothetical protein n=1 Tax=Dactylosporangium sp. McL0621 TaxID=3415678 RepID=UPI003CEFE736